MRGLSGRRGDRRWAESLHDGVNLTLRKNKKEKEERITSQFDGHNKASLSKL